MGVGLVYGSFGGWRPSRPWLRGGRCGVRSRGRSGGGDEFVGVVALVGPEVADAAVGGVVEQGGCDVFVLDVGRGDDDVAEQAEGVDGDVAFAAVDAFV